MVIDTDTPADPHEGEMLFTQSFQLTGAADTFQRGIKPKTKKNPRIGGVAARSTSHGTNLLQQQGQVQLSNVVPDQTDLVVGRQQTVQHDITEFVLLPLSVAQTWRWLSHGLFGGRPGDPVWCNVLVEQATRLRNCDGT